MFNFIEEDFENKKVSEEYIKNIEQNLNITFPDILKQYYLQHNGASIKERYFYKNNDEFYIDYIYPLQKIIEEELPRIKGELPSSWFPLGNGDIFEYFWDTQTGTIYYLDPEYDKTPFCKSIDQFFEILNLPIKQGVTIIPKDNKPQEENITISSANNEYSIRNNNYENALKYNGKFLRICILVSTLITIILLVIPLFSIDLPTLILAFATGFYAIVFIIIDIINRIRSYITLKKYDINELKNELSSSNTIKIDGIDTYLTEHYIISNSNTIKVTRYDDIVWLHIYYLSGPVPQRGISYTANSISGIPLCAYLKNEKRAAVARIKDPNHMAIISQVLREKTNDNVIIGNTHYDRDCYMEISKKYAKKQKINDIIICIVLAFSGIGVIYALLTSIFS